VTEAPKKTAPRCATCSSRIGLGRTYCSACEPATPTPKVKKRGAEETEVATKVAAKVSEDAKVATAEAIGEPPIAENIAENIAAVPADRGINGTRVDTGSSFFGVGRDGNEEGEGVKTFYCLTCNEVADEDDNEHAITCEQADRLAELAATIAGGNFAVLAGQAGNSPVDHNHVAHSAVSIARAIQRHALDAAREDAEERDSGDEEEGDDEDESLVAAATGTVNGGPIGGPN
jgi:hypothetical protein